MQDIDMQANERFAKLVSPFVSLTHPFIKSLFELTSNFDTFREKPVYGQYYKKIVSPIPTVVMDAFPEYIKNWFGAEEKKTKTGFRVYHIDSMKAKILENLIPLSTANLLMGYAKYEGYAEQKQALDKISFYTGLKLYPVDLDYLQGKYKAPIQKISYKKKDWTKYKTEGSK